MIITIIYIEKITTTTIDGVFVHVVWSGVYMTNNEKIKK